MVDGWSEMKVQPFHNAEKYRKENAESEGKEENTAELSRHPVKKPPF